MSAERTVLVDASAFITLAEIGRTRLLRRQDQYVYLPETVIEEIEDDPANSALKQAIKTQMSTADEGWIRPVDELKHPEIRPRDHGHFEKAAAFLGEEYSDSDFSGDVALLGTALGFDEAPKGGAVVVITDDKPLRKACKALGVPISGSIGVLIAAVERGDLEPDDAKDALVSMDEVGARLSARLLRKAERLIDEATEKREK